jgi:hypothetical protein
MATNLRRHRIPSLLIGLTAALGLLAACGGSDDDTAATTTAAGDSVTTSAAGGATATTAAPVSSMAPTDSADVPVVTTVPEVTPAPVDSSDIVLPPPPDTSDMPVVISVTVGVDSGEDRIESVPIGSVVSITITNPDSDDEFHLHGYDLGDSQEVAAGESVTFTFTADTAGEFELESHSTEALLLLLRVV